MIMAKYFTSTKVGLYLVAIIIIQQFAFNTFNLDRFLILEITSHSVFIIIGLICIRLNFHFHKKEDSDK